MVCLCRHRDARVLSRHNARTARSACWNFLLECLPSTSGPVERSVFRESSPSSAYGTGSSLPMRPLGVLRRWPTTRGTALQRLSPGNCKEAACYSFSFSRTRLDCTKRSGAGVFAATRLVSVGSDCAKGLIVRNRVLKYPEW